MIDTSVFVNLAKVLVEKNVNLEFESDFKYWKEHKEVKYTNTPYIGSGWYNGKDGYYFRKHGYDGWSSSEIEAFKSVHGQVIDGYQFELESISDVEYDDDRIWNASLGFFLTKV